MKSSSNQFGQKHLLIGLSILLAINFSLFYFPGFPASIYAISRDIPISQVPDVHLSYSPDHIYDFLTKIGPDGRETFRLIHLSVDLIFPILYSLFFFLLFRFLLQKINKSFGWLLLIPVLAGTFDLSENFILNFLTAQYPNNYPALTTLVEILTIVKFLFLTLSIFISAILALRARRLPK